MSGEGEANLKQILEISQRATDFSITGTRRKSVQKSSYRNRLLMSSRIKYARDMKLKKIWEKNLRQGSLFNQ